MGIYSIFIVIFFWVNRVVLKVEMLYLYFSILKVFVVESSVGFKLVFFFS